MTAISGEVDRMRGADPGVAVWMRAHPRTVDLLLVLLCACPPVVAFVISGEAGTLLPAAATVTLLWRRRAPLTVLTILAAATAASVLLSPSLVPPSLGAAVALYTVASLHGAVRAFTGYAIAVGMPALAGGIQALAQRTPFSPGILEPLALLGLTIGFAVRARRDRRQALTTLIARRAEQAVHTERTRIAAEMHDVVAHSLTVMIALAGGARAGWDTQPERARNALDQLGDVGATALDEIQRILRLLRSKDPGLDRELHASGHNVQALEDLIATFRAAGLPVRLTRRGTPGMPDPALDTSIHRIVQEALTNALRYAHDATVVDVTSARVQGHTDLTIIDDGRPAPGRQSRGAGAGLEGIRARAEAFGGTATAGPEPHRGWAVRVHLPATGEAPA